MLCPTYITGRFEQAKNEDTIAEKVSILLCSMLYTVKYHPDAVMTRLADDGLVMDRMHL